MPPSDKPRKERSGPYQSDKRKSPRPTRHSTEVTELPRDDANFPGGGTIVGFRDGKGDLHNHTFYPHDPDAVGRKWMPLIISRLYGGVDPGMVLSRIRGGAIDPGPADYDAFLSTVLTLKRSWEPPQRHELALFKTFPFTDSLRIRIWDPKVYYPGNIVRAFGLDFINIRGEPQSVHTQVEVKAGPRLPGSVEKEGDVLTALDDMGVRLSTLDGYPSRYAVLTGSQYTFTFGEECKTYSFAQDLLNQPVTRLAKGRHSYP